MSATIPDTHKDLLKESACIIISTVFDNGQPQSSVVWKKFDGEKIQFSLTTDRQKTKNMQKNPKISVLAIDDANPYKYIELRGEVTITSEGAIDLLDELAKIYTGKDKFYGGVAPAENQHKEQRVMVTLKPSHVVTYG